MKSLIAAVVLLLGASGMTWAGSKPVIVMSKFKPVSNADYLKKVFGDKTGVRSQNVGCGAKVYFWSSSPGAGIANGSIKIDTGSCYTNSPINF